MGEAFPVLEILLHSVFLQIFLLDHGLYTPWGHKIELAQKMHGSRG